MALTTVSRVSQELEKDSDNGGTDDDYIAVLIEEADAAISRYCGRANPTTGAEEFSSASRTEYYDGSGTDTLIVRNVPITTITSIAYLDSDGTATTVASDTYRVLDQNRIILTTDSETDTGPWYGFGDMPYTGFVDSPRWTPGNQNVRVVYTGGYQTIPADLRYVATRMVADMYMNRRGSVAWSPSGTVDGQGRSYRSADDFLRMHHARLNPYRRFTLG